MQRGGMDTASWGTCRLVPLIADRDEVQREPERLRAVTAGALG
jgi:hypothetical protein